MCKMEAIVRQGMPTDQKRDLDLLSMQVRMYLERWYKQDGQRHSKTLIKFEGDRYRPTEIEVHFRRSAKKYG